MKKKLSKTAQKKLDQKINVQLRQKYEQKILDEQRIKEDLKDGVHKIDANDIKNFNSKSFMEAMKESGIDTKNDIFADLERVISNNESVKELVDVKNIRMKTNVTDEQHKIIVILYGAYKSLLQRYGIDFKGLRVILDEFIEIAPSISGVRAEQFVDAHKAIAQRQIPQNPNAIREQSDMKT